MILPGRAAPARGEGGPTRTSDLHGMVPVVIVMGFRKNLALSATDYRRSPHA